MALPTPPWPDGVPCGVVDEPGALVRADLRPPDPDAARAFSPGVCGYRDGPAPDTGSGCSTSALAEDGTPLEGTGETEGGGGRDPHRLVPFGVAAQAALAGAPSWVVDTDGHDARRAG